MRPIHKEQADSSGWVGGREELNKKEISKRKNSGIQKQCGDYRVGGGGGGTGYGGMNGDGKMQLN